MKERSSSMVGKTIGRLYVVERVGVINKNSHYRCVCECGNETIVSRPNLKTHTRSCGCLSREITSMTSKTHGLSRSSIHNRWNAIKQRCGDKNNKHYGGRGISICDEWSNSFISFYEWSIKNGYSEELEIDRINNNGNYEPSNCRWVEKTVNQKNKNPYFLKNKEGITFCKNRNMWVAQIGGGKNKRSKRFKTREEAISQRIEWAEEWERLKKLARS